VWRNNDHPQKQGEKETLAFDNVKKTTAKEVVLANPDFTKHFDI
jgi:hypothetical protein